jgi:hypothetical protein
MTTTNTLMRHALCFFPAQDEINDLNVHIPGRSGRRWTWLGFLEFPFSCFDYYLGRLAYLLEIRFGMAITAYIAIRVYAAQLASHRLFSVFLCNLIIYPIFVSLLCKGVYWGHTHDLRARWQIFAFFLYR